MQHSPLTRDINEMLAATPTLWEAYRDARVFLTGGTGMVGIWLVESFLAANEQFNLGAELVLLTRNAAAFVAKAPHLKNHPALTLHYGDIRHFLAPTGQFTHILHAATASSGEQAAISDLEMAATIVDGTKHVLHFARTQPGVRLLYVSSAAIYGRTRATPTPIREDDFGAPQLTDPNIAYDQSKRMAETLCMLHAKASQQTVTIARCFAMVGPHLPRNTHFAIGNFIRDALADGPIRVNGDGSPIRSYLYLADVARYLWTLLAKGETQVTYNVGSPEAVTMAELASRVAANVNPSAKVEILGATKATAGVLNYQVPDISRAQTSLTLTPAISLDEAIKRTAEWYQATPVSASVSEATSVLQNPDAVIFDFDGVMTDNRVLVSQDGTESVLCNRSDGLGIGFLKERKIPMLVLSKEPNPVVAMRCKKLGLECLQGIDHKQVTLSAWLAERGFRPERTIYLGNDVNDLECMRFVGFPVAVGDAYPEVKAIARLVLQHFGGHGAVRELADTILAN